MAELPLSFYKTTTNGVDFVQFAPQGTAASGSGLTPIDYQTAKTILQNSPNGTSNWYDTYLNSGEAKYTPYGDALRAGEAGLTTGSGMFSGPTTSNNAAGLYSSPANAANPITTPQQAQAAIQASIPAGSAGAALNAGLANGTVSPTDPNAQMAASLTGNTQNQPGVTPVAPGSVTPPVQATPPPDINSVLQSVYSTRPDLQTVYNPDGSKKNPNDGNPKTLLDWAKTFGVNESPLIKQALNPATSQAPNTNAVGSPTSSTGQATGQGAGGGSPSGSVIPPGEDPTKFVNDTYSKVYGELGLSDIKAHYDDTNKQLLDLKNKVVDEKSAIDADPWLTEGIRVAENARIDKKYEQKQANLLSYLTLTNNMYQEGLNQAQFLTGQAVGLYSDQKQFDQQVALKQMDAAQAGADARAQIAQNKPFYKYSGDQTVYSTATGKPVSYEQYIASGGNGSFSDTFEIKSADETAAKTQVLGLMASDPGAGILPSDDLATATAKFKAGAVYRKDTYIAPTGSRVGTTTSTTGTQSSYQTEQNARIIQSVDNLLPQIDSFTVGAGGAILSKVPGTPAYNFRAQLDTLKSNIAFGALTQMREASKTGGALGQISDAEERLLSSTLGALDPGQSPDILKTQLQQIKDSITRWNDAASASTSTTSGSNDPLGLFQ